VGAHGIGVLEPADFVNLVDVHFGIQPA
jgi:hypothetical protein